MQVRSPSLSLRRCRDESQASIWPGKGSARAEASRGPTGRDHSCGYRGIYAYIGICYILKAAQVAKQKSSKAGGKQFHASPADVASRAPRSNEGDVEILPGRLRFQGLGLRTIGANFSTRLPGLTLGAWCLVCVLLLLRYCTCKYLAWSCP